jgi:hypothetical protein
MKISILFFSYFLFELALGKSPDAKIEHPASQVLQLTLKTFDGIVGKERPVMVKFYAPCMFEY